MGHTVIMEQASAISKLTFVSSCVLLIICLCASSTQAFGGSSGFLVTRSPDFTGPQTLSDFDILRDMIVNGGLSVAMKNRLRFILRNNYAKELKAYIEKHRVAKKNKRSAKRESRTINMQYKDGDGFAYHLMPDLEQVVMSVVFPVPVDTLYSTLFGEDSSFYLNWMQSLQTSDISVHQWNPHKDNQVRHLSYKVKGGSAPEEYFNMKTKQIRFGSSEEGVRYVVDNHNYIEGVHSETFHTIARHSLRALSQNESELRVSVDLKVESEDRWLFWSVMEDQVFPEYEADYRKLEELLSSTFGA